MSRRKPMLRDAVQAELGQKGAVAAWELAAGAHEAGEAQQRHEARTFLGYLAKKLPAAAWTLDRLRLAKALGLPAGPQPTEAGVAAFPAVDARGGGRFVLVRVRAGDGGDPGGEDPRSRLIRRAFDAARALLQAPETRFRLTFDSEDWSGDSAGLAVAIAAVSAGRNVVIPPLCAFTGDIDASGRVGTVGYVPEKMQLRRAQWPLCRLFVPAGDDPHHPSAVPVSTLAEAFEQATGLHPEDLDERLREIRAIDARGAWLEAARAAQGLRDHPDLSDAERLELDLLRLMAANHDADEAAKAEITAPIDVFSGVALDGTVYARLLGALTIRHLDELDPTGAERVLALAGEVRGSDRIHVDGPRAMLATLRGDFGAALHLRSESLKVAEPAEKPRCMGDLADALLRAGDAAGALDRAEQAIALARNLKRRPGYQQLTTRYLQLHRARALQALGLREEALRALAEPLDAPGLDPRLRARLLRMELTGEKEAFGDSKSTIVRALIARTLARLGDPAAAEHLLALRPFAGLDLAEAARRLPY